MNRYTSMSKSAFAVCSFLTGLVIMSLVSGCGQVSSTETRTDPQDRITFELPVGWTEAVGSSGTRFKPPASMGSVQVQVNTVDRSPRHTVEAERDSWLSFQRENGQKVLFEDTRDINGFHIVEYAHTGENATGSAVWHYVLMQRDAFIVASYLMAGPGTYEQQLPVFRQIVDSIQPVEETGTEE